MPAKRKEITWEVNESGCWICTSHAPNGNGYPQYFINGKSNYLSHIMYERKNGLMPEEMCICHKCDTPMCINPEHLFLGTRKDNNLDRSKKGRTARLYGKENPNSKLTEEQIILIRNMQGLTHKQIANMFNVTRGHVTNIRRRHNWKNLNQGVI